MATSSRIEKPIGAALLVGIGILILFMALFALEISHGLIRENGKVAKSLFAFVPAIAMFWGMLTRRRWALALARIAAGGGALWYFGWAVAAAVLRPHDQHGAVWIWILVVSLTLAGIAATAAMALGRRSVKRHYGMVCPECDAPQAALTAYFANALSCSECDERWSPNICTTHTLAADLQSAGADN